MISSEIRRREKLPDTNHSALNTTNNSLRDNLFTFLMAHTRTKRNLQNRSSSTQERMKLTMKQELKDTH